MPLYGELIAISTVLCWTISTQFFEVASKRVGPIPVNIIRIMTALLFFFVILIYQEGSPIPLNFPIHAWIWLSLSGVIGFFLGDIFLFKAFVEIGTRVTMLIMSLSAPVAAITGWMLLGETYSFHQWLGMLVTIAGVSVVILDRKPKKTGSSGNGKLKVRNITVKGVLFAMGGMLGQAWGFVMSKTGMQVESGYLDAFAATEIRAIAACICFILFFTFTGRWKQVGAAVRNRKALGFIIAGSAMGPVLGVSLSLLTLHYLSTGIASTILSLVPVFLIPFAVFIHKEHVSFRAVSGALLAVFGIYMLMG